MTIIYNENNESSCSIIAFSITESNFEFLKCTYKASRLSCGNIYEYWIIWQEIKYPDCF
jgi:hypothetical protein